MQLESKPPQWSDTFLGLPVFGAMSFRTSFSLQIESKPLQWSETFLGLPLSYTVKNSRQNCVPIGVCHYP